MYDIAADYINGFNGLGDTAVPEASAQKNAGIDWTSVINTGIETGGKIAETAIDNKQQRQNEAYRAGDNPSTYTPSNYTLPGNYNYNNNSNKSNKKQSNTDYMPWIIGGGIALALLMVVMMNNNKKR